MTEEAKSQKEQESVTSARLAVDQFLESLDGIAPADATTTTTAGPDAKEILSFLDEITSTSTASITAPDASSNAAEFKSVDMAYGARASSDKSNAQGSGSWATWGTSLWNQAQTVVKQTTEQIREAANNPETQKMLEERVKDLQNLVDKERIGKIGSNLRNLTISGVNTILKTVAPPISEHEVVEVWLSHDMVGYVGVEALVYRAFTKVLEQTEVGDVVVRKGNPNTGEELSEKEVPDRDLNACEGFTEAVKLARANIEYLIKTHYLPSQPNAVAATAADLPKVPVKTSPIFLVIQPCIASPVATSASQLFYVILLQDPTHNLAFESFSQSIPISWLDVPYEENEWVEDKMVECIRLAVMSIAQDYVWTRMTGEAMQSAVLPTKNNTEAKVEAEKEFERSEILGR